jgi:2-aminobenzoate-CoA ligase
MPDDRHLAQGALGLGPSGHVDSFARDRLPPADEWPEFRLQGFDYPEWLNAAVELTDRMVERGLGDRVALIGNGRRRTYKELADWTNRIAHALVEDYGVRPGNRVLIRSANNPAMVACWLAATKAGAVVVNTMPMLRAGELGKIVDKAEIGLALCDTRLMGDLSPARRSRASSRPWWASMAPRTMTPSLTGWRFRSPCASRLPPWAGRRGASGLHLGHDRRAQGHDALPPRPPRHRGRLREGSPERHARGRLRGEPAPCLHLRARGPCRLPVAFRGRCPRLLEQATPPNMVEIIEQLRATVCFTAPTAYRVMLRAMAEGADLSSLRAAVSAGETLPAPVYEEWIGRTGKPMLDGIGATELLHIFITNRFDDHCAGCTGRPVAGYEARIVGEDMQELPRGEIGRLAVKGPTGCRYLADPRQRNYVRDGWNLTGDSFWQDEEGRFHFAARSDDMIVSSGYNIAGPEVEAAILSHAAVLECAVVGRADEERGQIVEAHVVLAQDHAADDLTVKLLQDHVKAVIAPYKYPRSVVFVEALPKTATGKIQRFRLRQ